MFLGMSKLKQTVGRKLDNSSLELLKCWSDFYSMFFSNLLSTVFCFVILDTSPVKVRLISSTSSHSVTGEQIHSSVNSELPRSSHSYKRKHLSYLSIQCSTRWREHSSSNVHFTPLERWGGVRPVYIFSVLWKLFSNRLSLWSNSQFLWLVEQRVMITHFF